MAQNTYNDGDQLSVVRSTLNGNAVDAESRLSNLESNLVTTVQSISGASATQVLTDKLIVYDTSSNDGVINLLAASLWAGKTLNIKKTSTLNKVTIDPNAAELIDDLSSFDFFNRNESITIMSDGVGIKLV